MTIEALTYDREELKEKQAEISRFFDQLIAKVERNIEELIEEGKREMGEA